MRNFPNKLTRPIYFRPQRVGLGDYENEREREEVHCYSDLGRVGRKGVARRLDSRSLERDVIFYDGLGLWGLERGKTPKS